ncbi:MAG: DUF433 domain-containing protein [Spirulinaceae cyanobacterium]
MPIAPYPHIEKPQNQAARLTRLPRIRVAQIVMDYLAYGWSVEEMCRQHPYLRLGEAHMAMAYYFDHQAEMDREIATEWEQFNQARLSFVASPFALRMQLRQR